MQYSKDCGFIPRFILRQALKSHGFSVNLRIMKTSVSDISRIIVIAVAAILLLPWGSRTHFNTKGEPREAIVAVSMLESGNWVLPESYGHDIPYKPPMLAWCIAGASVVLNGGHVSEFTSRLPSALAAFALVIMTFNWVARRRDTVTAALTAMVLLTSFEFFRTAVICRVDMLLTFFTVGSIFLLDTEGFNRKRQAIRVTGAIILMGCATLTKGPVGALLPCLIVGVYRLFRRRNFFVTVLKLSACAIAAFAIASVWYYAAYLQGGSHFLDLAMEENIGRLTGTMTYDSHLNPWYYNLICVAYGMSPYIILAILAAIALNRKSRNGRPVENIRNARTDNSENGADTLLAWCGAVLTIGFYCIPASKRSTYLLPAYPLMAFGIVLLYNRLRNIRSQMPKYFARFMATLAVTVTLAMTILRSGMADSLAHGKNAAYILAIADGPMSWWEWIILWLPLASVAAIRRLAPDLDQLAKAVTYTVTIYIAFLCTIQPLLLNPRSNISAAAEVESMASGSTPIYSYLGDDPYMRYFTMNYYLGDRMRMLEKDTSVPDSSLLLMNRKFEQELKAKRPEVHVAPTGRRFVSCDKRRDTVDIYRVYLNPICKMP